MKFTCIECNGTDEAPDMDAILFRGKKCSDCLKVKTPVTKKSNAHHMMTCIVCGNKYQRSKGAGHNSYSDKCAAIRKAELDEIEAEKNKAVNIECDWCHKPFESNGRRRYCSEQCRALGRTFRQSKAGVREVVKDE